ncbi:MAG TPA: hypothetical protein VI278_09525, partial [Nitrososphaeraceae archaeon]
NVNPNRNTASSNSSSASDASNENTIDNTALARQRQAEASCAVTLTCPEGTTTVTPPVDPCPHAPYTDFVGGLCQNGEPTFTCTTLTGSSSAPRGPDANNNCEEDFLIGSPQQAAADRATCSAAGGQAFPEHTNERGETIGTCIAYPATPNCPTPTGSTQTPTVAENGRCTIQPGPA